MIDYHCIHRLPSFSGLTNDNSMTLPAYFSLKLRRPMPVSLALVQRINEVTGLDCADLSNEQSLISLIIQQAADGHPECNSNRGLFVVSHYLKFFFSFSLIYTSFYLPMSVILIIWMQLCDSHRYIDFEPSFLLEAITKKVVGNSWSIFIYLSFFSLANMQK